MKTIVLTDHRLNGKEIDKLAKSQDFALEWYGIIQSKIDPIQAGVTGTVPETTESGVDEVEIG